MLFGTAPSMSLSSIKTNLSGTKESNSAILGYLVKNSSACYIMNVRKKKKFHSFDTIFPALVCCPIYIDELY